MASNNGYSNIPVAIRPTVMQTINQVFTGPEGTAMLNLIDLIFANAAKRATLVGASNTGFANMTGSTDKTALATGSVTLPQLAARVKAIEDALKASGELST